MITNSPPMPLYPLLTPSRERILQPFSSARRQHRRSTPLARTLPCSLSNLLLFPCWLHGYSISSKRALKSGVAWPVVSQNFGPPRAHVVVDATRHADFLPAAPAASINSANTAAYCSAECFPNTNRSFETCDQQQGSCSDMTSRPDRRHFELTSPLLVPPDAASPRCSHAACRGQSVDRFAA